MGEINGYRLLKKLTTQNAGFCKWGFCTKGNHEFFIKEFLSPVYPSDSSELSQIVIERKQRLCENFFNEKKELYDTLSQCRTGNNVIIEDFFRFGSKYYMITDKVSSAGIDPRIISRLSDDRKEALIRSILYSVASFHEAGVIHADIKPDNMLLKQTKDSFYTAKIIDFDSGFLVNRIPKAVQGDFLYLSPEVFQRMSDPSVTITEKIDIFALGILFHQYWTGTMPAIASDYHYVFEAVLDGSTPTISNRIPDHIRSMIQQMLSLNPEERPSARNLLFLLTSLDKPYQEETPTVQPSQKKTNGFYVPTDFD